MGNTVPKVDSLMIGNFQLALSNSMNLLFNGYDQNKYNNNSYLNDIILQNTCDDDNEILEENEYRIILKDGTLIWSIKDHQHYNSEQRNEIRRKTILKWNELDNNSANVYSSDKKLKSVDIVDNKTITFNDNTNIFFYDKYTD